MSCNNIESNQKSKSDNKKIEYHSGIKLDKCSICNSNKVKMLDACITEIYFGLERDVDGNFHDHDGNSGSVVVQCENGHKTTQEYIPSCSCGWYSGIKEYNIKFDKSFNEANEFFGGNGEW